MAGTQRLLLLMVLMDIAPTLLNKPVYVPCEFSDQRKIRLERCIGKQKANQARKAFDPAPYPDCEKCAQGLANIHQATDKAGRRGKPRRGKGPRNETCEFYSICLDLAAKKDWKTWNCKNCEHYGGNKTVSEKIENTRTCETKACENKTISPKHPFCASCLARKSNEARTSNKARKAKLKAPVKSNTKGRGKAEKSSHVGLAKPIQIQIDFGKHTLVLDEIKDLAEEEMRPIEWQIIYMLKNHLKGIKEGTLQTK